MGHVRLGTLPRTRKWQQVAALLGGDARIDEIAGAVSDAAEQALNRAADDPALSHAFWLLTQIPLAAQHWDRALDENTLTVLAHVPAHIGRSAFLASGLALLLGHAVLPVLGREQDGGR